MLNCLYETQLPQTHRLPRRLPARWSHWRGVYHARYSYLVRGVDEISIESAGVGVWAGVDAAVCAHGREFIFVVGTCERVEENATVGARILLGAIDAKHAVVDCFLWVAQPGWRFTGHYLAMADHCGVN